MAHHNSTPQTVLDAPVSQPEAFYPQLGFNRRERRHGVYFVPGTPDTIRNAVLAEARAAGKNKPAVRVSPRVVEQRRAKRAELAAAHKARAAQ